MSVPEISSDSNVEKNNNDHKDVTSFYSKKAYLTPLQRQKLKRFHCEVSSPPQPEQVKKRKKMLQMKKSTTKENHNKHPKSKLKVSNKKFNVDINPSAFMCKKDVLTPIANRKFFKSRSPSMRDDRNSVTCKSIMPVDMKAATSVIHDRKSFKVGQKKDSKKKSTVTPIIHRIHLAEEQSDSSSSVSHGHTASPPKTMSSATPLKKEAAAMKWVRSSFVDGGARKENVLVNDASLCPLDSCSDANNEVMEALVDDHGDMVIQVDQTKLQVQENKPPKKKVQSASNKFYDIFDKTRSKNVKGNEQMSSPKSSSKDMRRLKTFNPADKDQLMIDAGQKDIGARTCSTCSMIYHIANDQDEELHHKFHANYLASLKFSGWKKEKVIGKFLDGRVVMISNQDPKFMMQKVEDVLSIVNRDLGFADVGMPSHSDAVVLLFISLMSKVIGCLSAEPITSAYPAEFDEKSGRLLVLQGMGDKKVGKNGKVKALCGINRLWVDPNERKNRIASRMVDCLRCNFYFGYPIHETDLAFLDPSIEGKEFAVKYNKSKKLLVYK